MNAPETAPNRSPISGAHRPRFSGPSGGAYRAGRRALYVLAVTPARGHLLPLARSIVRAARSSWPTPALLGAFVAAMHTEGGCSVALLARRYGCAESSVLRWLRGGGPLKRSSSARVVLHATQKAQGMATPVPSHVARYLRASLFAPEAAALALSEVAQNFNVQEDALRGSSRAAPLPELRQLVIQKATRMGATVSEVARALDLDPAYVSRTLSRVGGDA